MPISKGLYSSVLAGFFGVVLATSPSSEAGTQLRLRTGTVQIDSMGAMDESSVERDYIVQFKSTITAEDQSILRSSGAKILRYVPDDSYVVRGRASRIRQALNHRLQAMSVFERGWKLSLRLLQNLAAEPFLQTTEKVRSCDILAFSDEDAVTIESTLKSMRLQLARSGRTLRVKMPLASVAKLADLTGVENIELTPVIEMFDFKMDGPTPTEPQGGGNNYADLTGYESGTKLMNFSTAWDAGFTGEGQIASFADTGLDTGDLASLAADFTPAVNEGLIAGIGAKDWSDPMGHGTHVSGSIVGRGSISGGILKGGANGAKFYPEGMWSPLLDNLSVPAKLSDLFDPAYKSGARVHSNSWGSPVDLGAYTSMSAQVDDYMWSHQDFLILFAAGNSGADKNKDGVIDLGSVSSPGTAKNALTVGASKNLVLTGGIQKKVSELRSASETWPAEPIASSRLSETPGGIACFSSRGPTLDGRLKPEIVAPGTNVLSDRSHVPGASPLWGAFNDDYVWAGGTSMATPLTAGAATVVREILGKKYGVKNPSAALVKAMLANAAQDLYPGQFGESTPTQELQHRPDNNQGYGRVDLASVVELSNMRPLVVDDHIGLQVGQTREFSVDVRKGQSLLVNLFYTDAPGTPASGQNLVNDLDLEVEGPELTAASHDRINNNEVVELKTPAPGTYKIRIRAVNVPMGPVQTFALVATVR
ncbi:MAG: serine protease [Bdellovibrio sp.]|nr:MAG: serine protease [Bdellovibrio sp.]